MPGALVLEGAGWVASLIITRLLNEGFSCLGIAMDDRIEKLETILSQFQEVIDAAKRSGYKEDMENWLRRLKAAMYEAEDALDLYKYRLLQNKMEHGESTTDEISDIVSTRLSMLSVEKAELENCLKKLQEIALEAQKFRVLLEKQPKSYLICSIQEPMVTTSKPLSRIIGRDGDCGTLLQELLEPIASEPESSTDRSYSVHSIIGSGGAGKTTLAQSVYNDERLTTQFDLKIWLSMTRGLDVDHHTRIMIEATSKYAYPSFDSLDYLQDVLIDLIKSKKIFVVMDDVLWDDTMNELKWDLFIAPFASVKRGSRILVTGRSEKMPRVLLPQKILVLEDLEEDHFLTLFMHHALAGINTNNSHSLYHLEQIGKEIAKKLSRSPLVAKVVGSCLFKNLNERFWQDTLENDLLHDTMESLIWSYRNLDEPIQRCFSYCGIFPKGYLFRVKDMVQLWVAEGFIKESSTRRIEDVGVDYFEELLSLFFFQSVDAGIENYSMHDLFHDLAERVSKDDCLRIEDGQSLEIPPGIYHLSLVGERLNEFSLYVEKLKNIRTMIFLEPVSDNVVNSFLKSLGKFQKLRVLSFFKYSSIKEVPNSIGELVRLRYLNISTTEVKALPESVEKLYNLQTLKLRPLTNHLPKGINKLINLRQFQCKGVVISEIGKLTSLQTLSEFTVKKEKGYEIGELMFLDEIEGSIGIYDLQNVEVERAAEAKLINKKHITCLRLHWGDDVTATNSISHSGVLEYLKPHQNLKQIEIVGYKSSTYPSWMLQPGCLENLVSLSLFGCFFLETLPSISTLFPYLNTLSILLPKLTQLPTYPSRLKDLEVRDCETLVLISKEELHSGRFAMELDSHHKVDTPEEGNISMYVNSKRNKYSLILPPGLEKLRIAKCYITEKALSYCLIQATWLRSLSIENITTITAFPPEEVLSQLVALTHQTIVDCDCLISIAGICALLSLEKLWVSRCPCLEIPREEGRDTFPPSLISVTIDCCDAIEHIKATNMPLLSSVVLFGCRKLKSIELTNIKLLNELSIHNCPVLFELICSSMHSLEKLQVFGSLDEETCSTSGMLALPSLKKLCTNSYWMVRKLLDKGQLTMLENLEISSSAELFNGYESLGLNSLRHLMLFCCNLQVLPSATKKLSSLISMDLLNCLELSSLPDMPKNLKYLTIERCPCIAFLPDLPKSLLEIKIIDCPNLKKRCEEPDGEDWPKISHVRWRSIKSRFND